MPTTDELNVRLTALEARVNSLDGQNLADPSLAVTTVLAAKIAGVETTVRQSVLKIESVINGVKKDLAALKSTVYTHLGLTP